LHKSHGCRFEALLVTTPDFWGENLMLPTKTEKFTAYYSPAARYPQIWRLIAGLILAVAVYMALTFAFLLIPERWGISLLLAVLGRGSPLDTSVLLASFAGMGLGIWLAARVFQKRRFATLFGPDLRVAVRHFFVALGIMSVAVVVLLSVAQGFSASPTSNLPVKVWLIWLPSSLVLILVQTGSEELVFRGYLQQQLAARFSSRWVWWVLPSALFGLAHYSPAQMGENAWLMVIDTFIVGLIAADLTARTGTLGAAIGLHFANNVAAMLLVSTKGSISGLSLFVTDYTFQDVASVQEMLVKDIGSTLMLYALYLIVMRRRAR